MENETMPGGVYGAETGVNVLKDPSFQTRDARIHRGREFDGPSVATPAGQDVAYGNRPNAQQMLLQLSNETAQHAEGLRALYQALPLRMDAQAERALYDLLVAAKGRRG